ncbi:hypothetical protein Pcinc_023545 [Petrolisthes cinctipes]|uniref:Uncharacterized protein n=1 Tax=Petrolisthes cinctipes TaxID=88211 RepID=A0AAE1FC46_PETCI|nr:hypothetical protein Pcinc_023545 [Petrolisthes cinctipes]
MLLLMMMNYQAYLVGVIIRGSSLDVSLDRISQVSDNEDGCVANGETDVERLKSRQRLTTSVTIDDVSVNKYFAVIYTAPKKQYYWGKVTKVSNKVEMMFQHRKTLSSMPE